MITTTQEKSNDYCYIRTTCSVKYISGVSVPDAKRVQETTEFIRDTETELLFNHSSRVYYFGALAGKQRGLKFDAELLYAGAMFHDLGLMPDSQQSRRPLRG
jgi:HD superfamily phosphodiesterase